MKNYNVLNTFKILILALTLAVGMQYAIAATAPSWQAPQSGPPANDAFSPINVSNMGQTKDGGLTLGHTVGSNQPALIIENGRISIGVGIAPTEDVDASGYVKGRTGLCIGNDCRTIWPGGGGTGGGLGGSGTINRIPKFTAATTLGNSNISDNGTKVTFDKPIKITAGSPADGSVLTAINSSGDADWKTPGTSDCEWKLLDHNQNPASPQDLTCPSGKIVSGLRFHDWDTGNNAMRVKGIKCCGF